MNADDAVLVVLLNNPRDYEIVAHEHWYRIPVRHAPRFFSGAQYLAFYLASAFGERKWAISEFAAVRGHELVRRRDLIAGEADHPRADELYYKLQLGPLETRATPIVSKRGRRVLYLWTTGERFLKARELNDLFHQGSARDALWDGIRAADLDAEREVIVRDGRSRYRVDLLVYCPRGRLAVSIGRNLALRPRAGDLRAISVSEEELDVPRLVAQIKQQVRELGEYYPRSEAQG